MLSDRIKYFDKSIPANEPVSVSTDTVYYNLCEILSQKIEAIPIWFEYTDDEQHNLISNFVNSYICSKPQLLELSEAAKDDLTERLCNSFFGLGIFDLMISKCNVKKIIAYSNENIAYELEDGSILQSDVSITILQYEKLVQRLKKFAGSEGSVVQCRIKNLFVTLFNMPFSSPRLIIEKIPSEVVNFHYLKNNKLINSDIANFLRDLISNKVSILIVAPVVNSTALITSAFLNEIPQDENSIFFTYENTFNIQNKSINIFNLATVSQRDRTVIFSKYKEFKPSYVLSSCIDPLCNSEILCNLSENSSYILPVIAGSPSGAVTCIANGIASLIGISDKLAKSRIAEQFKYIIHIDNNTENNKSFSIKRIDTNKAASLIIKDVLNFKNGSLICEQDDLLGGTNKKYQQKNSRNFKKKIPFSARFE